MVCKFKPEQLKDSILMRDKSLVHWYTQTLCVKGQKYRKPLSNHESHIDTTPVYGTFAKGRSLPCESLGKASYDFNI